MKTSIKDLRLASLVIALSIGMFISTPAAFANPGLVVNIDPFNVVAGNPQIDFELTPDQQDQNLVKGRVFNPNQIPSTTGITQSNNGLDCQLAIQEADTTPIDPYWTLVRKSTSVPVEISLDESNGDSVTIPFGAVGSGGFTVGSIKTTGNPLVEAPDGTALGNGEVLVWEEDDGTQGTDTVASTVNDAQHYHWCGFESTNNGQFNFLNNFEIQAPVGGSIIPLDTSALLVAGIFSSSLMVIPIVAGMSGVVGYYLYRQQSKQD